MVPFITKGGGSFRKAFLYFCHDKKAKTAERVAWTETRNLITDDPEKSLRIMDYTFRNRDRLKEAACRGRGGRNVEKPVYSYSLSWHPDERPTRREMIEAAEATLEVLGLVEFEALIVCHNDEPHSHVHLIINRIHPFTGIAANMSHSKRRLSNFALKYEKERGTVYCPQREQNHGKRQQKGKARRGDPVIAEAWSKSLDTHDFTENLRVHGYRIADGGKRLVVIDPYGNVINPLRHLHGVKARDFSRVLREGHQGGFPTVEKILDDINTTRNARNHPANPTEQ